MHHAENDLAVHGGREAGGKKMLSLYVVYYTL
jgi:hypothetical protein